MLQLLFDVLGEKGIIIIIRIVRITHAGTTLVYCWIPAKVE